MLERRHAWELRKDPEGWIFCQLLLLSQEKKNEAPWEVWGDEGYEMVPSFCLVAFPGPFYP